MKAKAYFASGYVVAHNWSIKFPFSVVLYTDEDELTGDLIIKWQREVYETLVKNKSPVTPLDNISFMNFVRLPSDDKSA